MNEIATTLSIFTLTGVFTNPNFFIIFIVLIVVFFLLGLLLGMVTKQSKQTANAQERIGRLEGTNNPRQTDTFGQDNLENVDSRSNNLQNRGYQNNELNNNGLKSEQRAPRYGYYYNKYW